MGGSVRFVLDIRMRCFETGVYFSVHLRARWVDAQVPARRVDLSLAGKVGGGEETLPQ